ncbi:MAG TPA: YbhB/YbcL family Raf kinase inhibitor-like protein [Acetobacteraceae bacterium]
MRTIAGAVLGLGLLAGGAAHAQGFTLSSPAVTEGGTLQAENIYNSFGCTGNDISPALNWTGAPAGTKSYAVTLYDPDAPTGSGFWHWSMFDIPATASGVVENAGNPGAHLAPKGSIQVRNDYGTIGYGGPCPPKGDKPHHYVFTVFAVDAATLGPKADATPAVVGFNLHYHTLAKATLTGMYGR